MAYSYENELNSLKEAQKNAAVASLENTRNEAMSNLQRESEANQLNYANQRNAANVQNRLNNKNFQEYLASTGRANSGLASQARLQNSNNLNTSLNAITGAENAARADINRRQTEANNAYNTGLASANANIETNYINNLLAQRQQQFQNELAEKQYNESVRQFNEQMALNRANSYRSGSSNVTNVTQQPNKLNTAYYSGDYNADAQYGTFSNGYQPNNIGGKKLTSTGETIDKVGKTLNGETTTTTQKLWTFDGGKTKYYWDGNLNKYVQYNG